MPSTMQNCLYTKASLLLLAFLCSPLLALDSEKPRDLRSAVLELRELRTESLRRWMRDAERIITSAPVTDLYTDLDETEAAAKLPMIRKSAYTAGGGVDVEKRDYMLRESLFEYTNGTKVNAVLYTERRDSSVSASIGLEIEIQTSYEKFAARGDFPKGSILQNCFSSEEIIKFCQALPHITRVTVSYRHNTDQILDSYPEELNPYGFDVKISTIAPAPPERVEAGLKIRSFVPYFLDPPTYDSGKPDVIRFPAADKLGEAQILGFGSISGKGDKRIPSNDW